MKTYSRLLLFMTCFCFSIMVQATNVLPPDPPTPSSNGPLCEGSGTSLQLTANPPAVGGPYTFHWKGPNGFISSDENPLIANPTIDNSGVYTLTIEDATGIESGSVTVEIRETPNQPFITSSSSTLCEGETLSLSVPTYTGTTVEYAWEGPNGSFPNVNSPILTESNIDAMSVGDYTIQVTVDGCSSATSPPFTLAVESVPVVVNDTDTIEEDRTSTTLDILANDDLTNTPDYAVNIIMEPEYGVVSSNGDGTYDYTPNTNFVGTDGFTYEVCNNSCEAACSSAFVSIVVNASAACTPPSVFTPNGDGANDTFRINCLPFYPDAELQVFNRWGDHVYKGQNYQNDWTGTMNGEELPVGTYYYVLKLNDTAGQVLSGYIYLQR